MLWYNNIFYVSYTKGLYWILPNIYRDYYCVLGLRKLSLRYTIVLKWKLPNFSIKKMIFDMLCKLVNPGTEPFWRRCFGADVLTPTFWRRFILEPTFWRKYVLAPRRFGVDVRRQFILAPCNFGAETFWRRDVLAPRRFGAKSIYSHFSRLGELIPER